MDLRGAKKVHECSSTAGGSSNASTDSAKDLLVQAVEQYDIAHKHLVQLILNYGILPAHFFYRKFVQYVKVYIFEGERETFTQAINDAEEKEIIKKLTDIISNALAPIELRLVQIDDEFDDDNTYIVLLNDRRQSDVLREASGFTPTDFALFHVWLSAICASESGIISKHDALSTASDFLATGKKVDEERLLRQFISNKWLAMDNDQATIRLGARGIAELQDYFGIHADEYGFQKCTLCGKFIVIKCRAVSCETCKSLLHRQCALKGGVLQRANVASKRYIRIIKSAQSQKAMCPGKLETGRVCTAEICVPLVTKSDGELPVDGSSEDNPGIGDNEAEVPPSLPVSQSVVESTN